LWRWKRSLPGSVSWTLTSGQRRPAEALFRPESPRDGTRAVPARSTSLGRGGLENPRVFTPDEPLRTRTVRGPAMSRSSSAQETPQDLTATTRTDLLDQPQIMSPDKQTLDELRIDRRTATKSRRRPGSAVAGP